jgi:hypothetical protein
MEPINLGAPDAKEKVKELHDALDEALSCLGGLQQPLPCTSQVTEEDELKAHIEMDHKMFVAVETILSGLYGGKNGSGFVFKV